MAAATAPTSEAQALECTLVHKDGSARQFEILFTNLLEDEHVGGIVLNARDVSERKAFEAQLTHQAFHDTVTGLANRALFGERVRHAIARARREERGSRGASSSTSTTSRRSTTRSATPRATRCLLEVARRLDSSIRGADTAARFGGDEFAVLLEDVEGSQEAADTAERSSRRSAQPLRAGHKELALRCSLGISVLGPDDTSRRRRADPRRRRRDVHRQARRQGRLPRCSSRRCTRACSRGSSCAPTSSARIATDQLELHYQPVVRLTDGSVAGVEALLRWHHPERGMVAPDEFIPIAEETGLIVPIGRWVLREGCRHAKRMLASMPGDDAVA